MVSARDVCTEEARVALEKLCQIYWPPLYGGDFIYALTTDALFVLSYSDADLKILGSVLSPYVSTGNVRLAVGNGIAYATHAKGYNTFNVVDPSKPSIDPASVTSGNIRVLSAGADGVLGTADDVTVAPSAVSYRDGVRNERRLSAQRSASNQRGRFHRDFATRSTAG